MPTHLPRPSGPSKIVCVGRNYAEHAKELGNEAPAEPIIFLKPPSSLISDGDPIVYPAISDRVDFEGELGIVVGIRCRNVSMEQAENCILGYTIINDVTARDLQRRDGQWTRGKGFDTFCPVAPWYVPAAEVDLDAMLLVTSLNNEVKQRGAPRDMLFSVNAIIAFVTQFMTLERGDLIATGTPPGVGPMQPGDIVRVDITGLGSLQNRVIQQGDQP